MVELHGGGGGFEGGGFDSGLGSSLLGSNEHWVVSTAKRMYDQKKSTDSLALERSLNRYLCKGIRFAYSIISPMHQNYLE